jgi:hypothetical protein
MPVNDLDRADVAEHLARRPWRVTLTRSHDHTDEEEASILRRSVMHVHDRKLPRHLIPIHVDNASSKDWIILLEAGTIVGPSPDRLRVARATLERKVVIRRDLFLRSHHFLVVEDYDPRIHAVYFCPQLYRQEDDKKLVPLHGEEIGTLIAHALEKGTKAAPPWYEPAEKLPDQPVISATLPTELDSLVVEMPARSAGASAGAPMQPMQKSA